jgi:hypothetical protein
MLIGVRRSPTYRPQGGESQVGKAFGLGSAAYAGSWRWRNARTPCSRVHYASQNHAKKRISPLHDSSPRNKYQITYQSFQNHASICLCPSTPPSLRIHLLRHHLSWLRRHLNDVSTHGLLSLRLLHVANISWGVGHDGAHHGVVRGERRLHRCGHLRVDVVWD